MLVLLVLGGLVLLALAWIGTRMVLAGRQLESVAGSRHSADAPLATGLDRRLHRTRVMVEELLMPEVDQEDLRPSRTPVQERAQTYVVLGVAALGLAASMVIGMLLLL